MAPTFRRPSLPDGSLRRNHGHARGCKRTHLTFKEKATRWNRDKEIQNILADMQRPSLISPGVVVLDKGQQHAPGLCFQPSEHHEQAPAL